MSIGSFGYSIFRVGYNEGMSSKRTRKLPDSLDKKLRELEVYDAIPQADTDSLSTAEKADALNDLTRNQQEFIGYYLSGMSVRKAYLKAYPNATNYHLGYEILKKYDWIVAALQEEHGIGVHDLIQKHSKLLNSKNEKIQLQAVKLGYERVDRVMNSEEERDNQKTKVVIVRDETTGSFRIGIES